MASPPRLRGLTRESTPDAPAWWTTVLASLQTFFSDVTGALDKQLTRRENMRGDWSEVEFTTKATVSDTFPVLLKHKMAETPKLVWLGWLERDDGAIITTQPTVTCRISVRGELELYFQGLSAGTKYRARVVYE